MSPSIREHRHAKFARPAIGDLHFVAFIMRQMDVITRKYQRTLACTIRCFCGFAFRPKTYPLWNPRHISESDDRAPRSLTAEFADYLGPSGVCSE